VQVYLADHSSRYKYQWTVAGSNSSSNTTTIFYKFAGKSTLVLSVVKKIIWTHLLAFNMRYHWHPFLMSRLLLHQIQNFGDIFLCERKPVQTSYVWHNRLTVNLHGVLFSCRSCNISVLSKLKFLWVREGIYLCWATLLKTKIVRVFIWKLHTWCSFGL
jgi:hypothetical protein